VFRVITTYQWFKTLNKGVGKETKMFKVGDIVKMAPLSATEFDKDEYKAMQEQLNAFKQPLRIYEITENASYPIRLTKASGPIFRDYELLPDKILIKQLEV